MIELPEVVANKARSLGASAWLSDLGSMVSGLEQDWGVTVGRPYADATEGWVAPVEDRRGRPAVLKLCVPRPGDDPWSAARREASVLARAAGRGCVVLLRSDIERGALLLERLGPSMADVDPPFHERLDALADLASALWTPAPDLDLPTGAHKAKDLAEAIVAWWDELDRPCTRAAVDQALAAADRRERANDPDRAVLNHGDVHPWNALRAPGGEPVDGGQATGARWKLIDPDGLMAEPEYDLGVLLREEPEELAADIEAGDPRRRARRLADRTGTDPDAIWDWGLAERVSTGLLATRIDLQPIGAQMLAVADRLAGLDEGSS